MPQLDFFSYFSQFFWFCLVFLFLYFRLVIVYLPKFTRNLKIRKGIRERNNQLIINLNSAKFDEKEKQMAFVRFCMDKLHVGASDGLLFWNAWRQIMFLELNSIDHNMISVNENYLKSVFNLKVISYEFLDK